MNAIRFSLRRLAASPAYSLIVIALLAISIGASTAAFSVIDAILLRELPVSHPEQLVRMVQHLPKLGDRSEFPYVYYQALKNHATTLSGVFAESTWDRPFPLTDPKPVEQIRVGIVTPGFFRILGVHALYGRLFTPSEARNSSHTPPAVLSYRFWHRHFHADLRTIGKTIVLNQKHFVVVGVLPRGFNGIAVDTSPEVRIPTSAIPVLWKAPRDRMDFEIAGRLRPGVSRKRAEEECRTIWKPVVTNYYYKVSKYPPKTVAALLRRGLDVQSLARGTSILRSQLQESLQLLAGLMALVLLIVCTNIAGLLLARVAAHQQQYAIRLALGASRFRLMRQMLLENFLVTAAGAVGGFLVALAAIPIAVGLIPPVRDLGGSLVPLSVHIGMDMRAFLFLLAASAIAMLLFSATPVITTARLRVDTVFRGARSSVGWGGRRLLIMVQIALCMFLLVEAGLLVRTFKKLRDVNPGFDAHNIITFDSYLSTSAWKANAAQALLERVRTLPGVESAANSSTGVMREHGLSGTVAPAGQRITQSDFMNSNANTVSLGYFKTMGIRLLAGRTFLPSDVVRPKPTGISHVIVSQALANTLFPNTNAIGKRIGVGAVGQIAKPTSEIIGIVSDAKYRTLREPIKPMFYTPYADFQDFILNVRTRGNPESVVSPITKLLASADPNGSFLEVRTLTDEIDQTTAAEQANATLSSLFGFLALLLAAIGIYGLLSYTVTQRRREIGIRMALGGEPKHVAALVAREMLGITAIGIAIGVGGAFAAAPAIRSQLYGISPQDPLSIAIAVAVVIAIALLAAALPTIRAVRTEPAIVLRDLG